MRISKAYWVWGQFSEKDIDYLNELKKKVKIELDTPCFEHHITLSGPYKSIDGSFSSELKNIANKFQNIKLDLIKYSFKNQIFNSFYISILNSYELSNLREKIYQLNSFDRRKNYDPHISLAYGNHKKVKKLKLIEKLPKLKDSIKITRISIVDVDESIKSWIVLKSFNLKKNIN